VSSLRIIQWGAGAVGTHALRFVLESSDLDLVGVKCFTEEKDGRDVGELLGLAPVGVTATRDASALLSTPADCVLYMPRDVFLDPTVHGSPAAAWVDEVVAILESGKNVVSPLQSAMHWRHLADGESLRARLEAACRVGSVSVFFTGLDPGFISDCLAMTVASAAGSITQVRTLEVIDYDTYPSADTLASMGFGHAPAEGADPADDSLVPSWGCALWLVADSLGVELDDIVLATETVTAPESFTSAGGLQVERGTVAAMQWSITGMVGGEPRIVATHVARMRGDLAAQWPRIGAKGGYRVEVDGSPPLRVELPLGLDGGTGTCLGDAVVMTAARCVNSIRGVVDAPRGYRLLTELKIFGGRHSLVR
jgi:2,4-diaminopentanoate dehydrogenase